MSDMLVELEDVSYKANGQSIIEHADWQVRRGERWAVLGPNGSGKSTLLRLAGGYLRPNVGGVVRWKERARIDLRELRLQIGWVANDQTLLVPPTEPAVRTVVSGKMAQWGLVAFDHFAPDRDDFVRAADQMARLGIEHLADRPFGTLSQGEKQLVLIARACMARPWWVVLDEPCAGLDPGARELFLAGLQQLLENQPDVSLVLVTHHVEEIIPPFEQVLVMRGGQIAAQGRLADIVTRDFLEQLYQVRVRDMIEARSRWWPIFG